MLSTKNFRFTKKAFTNILESQSTRPNALKQIHALILTSGLSIKNSLSTQLLTYFLDLGNMGYARQLFDEMHKPRCYIWCTLIKGYAKNEIPSEAASVYRQMHMLDVRPDRFTFPFVLKACAELDDVWLGVSVHVNVLKYGLDFTAVVRTELTAMYVKFGDVDSADYLFENMLNKDLIAWNSLITAYAHNGNAVNAIRLFHQMGCSGIKPDSVTVVSVLSACSQLGCLETGKHIHYYARKEGFIDDNIILNNALLDLYMKCGSIFTALDLFNRMPRRNVISYSTMITGYAMNGDSEKALALLSRMKNDSVKPNNVTFLGVLSACSHAGLVKQGRAYFNYIARSNDKSLKPTKEHYACIVDLLGRSGHLQEAYNFIKTMPIEPDSAVWGALLGACKLHRNIELGQNVADCLFALVPDIGSYHVLLSNMYAAAGRWRCAERVRTKMRRKGVKKVVGYSSIEVNGQIHILHGGERMHPHANLIYEKLDQLIKDIKRIGYSPLIGSVLHDVDMEEKEDSLSSHSEKLAIAFGLINVRANLPIRVMKNLRSCDDCHSFCKYVSRITNREIVMRDKSRFHHFRKGICSCKDFW